MLMKTKDEKLSPKNWVSDYGDMLYGFAYIRVNDSETAKDLVQETFFSALRSADRFRGEISERNWLYTILKNKIIDHYRKNKREVKIEDNEEDDRDFFDEKGMWKNEALPKQWHSNPDIAYRNEEFFEVLQKCINKLNKIHSSVFNMKYLDEIDTEEICKEMEITKSNYWVMIHRAKLKIRRCLEKLWLSV